MVRSNRIADLARSIAEADGFDPLPDSGNEPGPGGIRPVDESPAYQRIVAILHVEPMLVGPCLRWLESKESKIAAAKLRALYSPEELAAMEAEVK